MPPETLRPETLRPQTLTPPEPWYVRLARWAFGLHPRMVYLERENARLRAAEDAANAWLKGYRYDDRQPAMAELLQVAKDYQQAATELAIEVGERLGLEEPMIHGLDPEEWWGAMEETRRAVARVSGVPVTETLPELEARVAAFARRLAGGADPAPVRAPASGGPDPATVRAKAAAAYRSPEERQHRKAEARAECDRIWPRR